MATTGPATPGRLGVFGGSFDPIHIGHLIVAEILRQELRLSQVIFLPAGRPPHKPDQQLAPDEDRLAMLEMSIDHVAEFTLSTLDITRGGYSYTADSLRLIREAYPTVDELYFLMGQDSLRDFPNWYAPARIAAQARLGAALRPGVTVDVDDVVARVPELEGRVELVPVPLIGVSSSDIRRRVSEGRAYRFQVLPEVADYIRGKNLYRVAPTSGRNEVPDRSGR